MPHSRVAYRYASALLKTAVQDNTLEAIQQDIVQVQAILRQSPELVRFLRSPIVKHTQKTDILRNIFQKFISHTTLNFILFLVEKRRENELQGIVEAFEELYNKHAGIVPVHITSAVELDADQKEKLLAKVRHLAGEHVIPSYTVDTALIGGFTVRIGDTVLDGSVRSQLEKLHDSLLRGVRRN